MEKIERSPLESQILGASSPSRWRFSEFFPFFSSQLLKSFRKSGQLADPHQRRSSYQVAPARPPPVFLFVGGSQTGYGSSVFIAVLIAPGKTTLAERLFHNSFGHTTNRIRKLEQSVKLDFPELASSHSTPQSATMSSPFPSPPSTPPPSLHTMPLSQSSPAVPSRVLLPVPSGSSNLAGYDEPLSRGYTPTGVRMRAPSPTSTPSSSSSMPSIARIDFLETEPTLREALTRGSSQKYFPVLLYLLDLLWSNRMLLLLYTENDAESVILLQHLSSALEVWVQSRRNRWYLVDSFQVAPDVPALVVRTMVDSEEDLARFNCVTHSSLLPFPSAVSPPLCHFWAHIQGWTVWLIQLWPCCGQCSNRGRYWRATIRTRWFYSHNSMICVLRSYRFC